MSTEEQAPTGTQQAPKTGPSIDCVRFTLHADVSPGVAAKVEALLADIARGIGGTLGRVDMEAVPGGYHMVRRRMVVKRR